MLFYVLGGIGLNYGYSTMGLGIGLMTGGLFGITYRYLIQGQENSHLKDGAVLAFGLVRGLVPLELIADIRQNWLFIGIILIKSLIGFLLTRLALDWAFHQGWIKS